jgi:hypothetical protein
MRAEQLKEMRELLIAEQNKRKAALAREDRARRQEEAMALARGLGLREAEGWRFEPEPGGAGIKVRHEELLGATTLIKEGDHLKLAESGWRLTPDSLYMIVEMMEERERSTLSRQPSAQRRLKADR